MLQVYANKIRGLREAAAPLLAALIAGNRLV
jgi:hypothetical protein